MNKSLSHFWQLETIGVNDDPYVNDNDEVMRMFQSTIVNVNGRYTVRWPFKNHLPHLPTNYGIAYNRFLNVFHKLQSNPTLLEKYNSIFEEQLQLGIIKKLDPSTVYDPLFHYLPHHPVVNMQKSNQSLHRLRHVHLYDH